ncbi:MAG: hypothetical protein MJ066_05895, partial [Clostridia bacterium]|nr:hypothetical protein [Clostridia bacterium]
DRDLVAKKAELGAADAKMQENADMLSSQLKDMKKRNTIALAVGAVGLIFALIALLKRKK